ncbi:MAG: hypothetical protein JWL83_4449 [Actinomycetia bacterium]|nr:hypothetical protein [Actinomycetes bacterium]
MRSRLPRVGPGQALAAIAVLYAAAQLLVVGVHHYFGFDEAVYFSKASSPRIVGISWVTSRALGLPWLLRPVTALDGGLVAMRGWLLFLSSIGLFVAFMPWVRLLRWPAVIGAALFAGSWLALFYGSAAYPNLPMGLAVVCATGWAVAAMSSETRRFAYAASALAFAVAATIRPTDALLQFGGFAIVLAVVRRRDAFGALAAGALGVAVGWLVWVVEAYRDFGGPSHRWHTAFAHVAGRPVRTLLFATAVAPLNARILTPRVLFAIAWCTTIVLTAAFACVANHRRDLFPVTVGIGTAAPLLAAYLLFPSDTEPRFLIPVYASLAVPSGVGIFPLLRGTGPRASWRFARTGFVVVVLGALLAWQIDSAHLTASVATQTGRVVEATGRYVRHEANGHPCRVGTDDRPPVLALASGCAPARILLGTIKTLPTQFSRAPADGTRRYLVARNIPPPGSPVDGWRVTKIEPHRGDVAFVFEPPGQR